MKLSKAQKNAICLSAQSEKISTITPMQSLWAGQGELARVSLLKKTVNGQAEYKSVVIKQIISTATQEHPRGWNTLLSQQRKYDSYQVELNWYREFDHFFKPNMATMRIPELIYSESSEYEMLLVLEDLAVDLPIRFTSGKDDRPTDIQIFACIRWLAQFHARFMNHDASGLWETGGYWHLDTRPDEWQAMPTCALKHLANDVNEQLASCPYQTLVHGDAKLANFCFDDTGEHVAAVDFQYVGQGPGVKDLMLFLSSVMPDHRLLKEASLFVDDYFVQLSIALKQWQVDINADDVIASWRPLYAFAWADFNRFLTGWSPNHWKIGKYCAQQTKMALQSIDSDFAEEIRQPC